MVEKLRMLRTYTSEGNEGNPHLGALVGAGSRQDNPPTHPRQYEERETNKLKRANDKITGQTGALLHIKSPFASGNNKSDICGAVLSIPLLT